MLAQTSMLRGIGEILGQYENEFYLRTWALLEPVLEGLSELTKEVEQLEELEEGEIADYEI